jgi:hypothetical protein
LEAGSNPLQEFLSYVEKYGKDQADMIMDLQYKNYSRLMYIAHKGEDTNMYKDQIGEITSFCKRWDMRYEERMGSDRYIKMIVDLTRRIHNNEFILGDELANGDFVIVRPGNAIEQRYFLR